MGRTTSGAVAAKWRARITQQRRSGLSIAEFCRRERISQPSFFNWRKRFTETRAIASRRGGPRTGRLGQGPKFLELPLPGWSAAAGIQLTLPSGAVVTLPPQASTETVMAVIRAAMIAPARTEDAPC